MDFASTVGDGQGVLLPGLQGAAAPSELKLDDVAAVLRHDAGLVRLVRRVLPEKERDVLHGVGSLSWLLG
jgi:hypothetical protein